ncbi:unnamed protein product [Notodromas monacha]|uniref:RING-type domain-containing protein n=1 Tax=Notodromas monacha TaxID=399045 RepID=A0A7R9BV71_9CRUS|nr:unnamed protein product [Notodromas monacha]CAG0921380.1 unnamed protein product [Notodromas monacha]
MPKRNRDGVIIKPICPRDIAESPCVRNETMEMDQFVPGSRCPSLDSMDSSDAEKFWSSFGATGSSGTKWKQLLHGNPSPNVINPIPESAPPSCFFCENVIPIGAALSKCPECGHEFCNDCVIMDFTQDASVPLCHSCYSERRRSMIRKE